jgi:hypothetical protein
MPSRQLVIVPHVIKATNRVILRLRQMVAWQPSAMTFIFRVTNALIATRKFSLSKLVLSRRPWPIWSQGNLAVLVTTRVKMLSLFRMIAVNVTRCKVTQHYEMYLPHTSGFVSVTADGMFCTSVCFMPRHSG